MLGFDYGESAAVYRLAMALSTALPTASSNLFRPMTPAPTPTPLKTVVLIGLMGAGKTSVGRRLAKRLGLPFTDADAEIVKAAGCSIEDIFSLYGEAAFRDCERRVIARLLEREPRVLATGGGAFMDAETRTRIRERGTSVWLRADLEVLVQRTRRRRGRPLLKNNDPRATLEALMRERYPVYAEADLVVDTGEEAPDITMERIIDALGVEAPARRKRRP